MSTMRCTTGSPARRIHSSAPARSTSTGSSPAPSRREQRGLADAHLGRVEHRLEQRLLALEVVVERAAAHTRGVEHRLDRRRVEAALGEQARRLRHELLTRRLAPVLASIHGVLLLRPVDSAGLDKPTVGPDTRPTVGLLDCTHPRPGSRCPACPSNASIPTGSLVPTPLGDVAAIDIGRGDPALFVHGVGTNAHLWAGVLDALGRRAALHRDRPARPRAQPRDRRPGPHDRRPRRSRRGLLRDPRARPGRPRRPRHRRRGRAGVRGAPPRAAPQLRAHQLRLPRQHPARGVRADGRARPAGAARTDGAPDLLADPIAARDLVFAMGYEDVDGARRRRARSTTSRPVARHAASTRSRSSG